MIPLPLLPANWKAIAGAVILLALVLQTFRLSATQSALETERTARKTDHAEYARAQAEAQSKALAQRAKDEAEYQEKADVADATIDDLRDDLRARLLRPQAAQGPSVRTVAQAQGSGAGLPQEMPAPAAADSGSVQVSADILAGLSAYAIKAHEWGLSLEEPR